MSRDLVVLAERIRAEARRVAQNGVAPLCTWDVAREVAFDASQRPSDVIAAARYSLTHPAPLVASPEQEQWEAELSAMSEAELDAAMLKLEAEIIELEAAGNEAQATPGPDVVAAAEDEPEPPEEPGTEVVTACLEILQRIGDGLDPRASGRDRMRAAELRKQHVAAANPRDAIWDEIESMTLEELESFLAEVG